MRKKKQYFFLFIAIAVLIGLCCLIVMSLNKTPKEDRYSHVNGPKNVKREDVTLTYGDHYCVRGNSSEEGYSKYWYVVTNGHDVSERREKAENYINPEWWYDTNFERIKQANEQFKTKHAYVLEQHELSPTNHDYLIYQEDCSMNYRLELAFTRDDSADEKEELERWLTLIDIVEAFNKEQEGYIEYIYLNYERYGDMDIAMKLYIPNFEGNSEPERRKILEEKLQRGYLEKDA